MTRPPIKAIVVRSPYAQEIASGEKSVEYRSWRTHYRGWLAVVAARRPESGGDAGRAVCLVRLAGCTEAGPRDFEWVLADPRPLSIGRPILVPGRLGLYDLPPELADRACSLVRPDLPRYEPRRPQAREIHQFIGGGPEM